MTKPRVPKCPENLKTKFISHEARQALNLSESILVSKYEKWGIVNIVDNYFLLERFYDATGHGLYSDIVDALGKMDTSSQDTKGARIFCRKFKKYLESSSVKAEFLQYYEDKERESRLQLSEDVLEDEVNISSNELISDNLRERGRKRRFRNIGTSSSSPRGEESGPIQMKINKKAYTLQSPTNVVTPNTPLIKSQDLDTLKRTFDICLSSNTKYASQDAIMDYNIIQNNFNSNTYIDKLPGARALFDQIVDMSEEDHADSISELKYDRSAFNRFVKFTMLDFAINYKRITPMPLNDERTLFDEIVVPLLRNFGNLTELLSFRWGEKKDKEAATAFVYSKDDENSSFNSKLLDGLGRTIYDLNYIVVESSGYDDKQNILHTIDDSIKNLKSATDSLKSFMSNYGRSSFEAFKKVHVYSIHVIQKRLTLIQYSLKTPNTWKVIECGTAEIPLAYDARKKLIKILELFAFLYNDLNDQKRIMAQLEDELLGYKEVANDETVMHHLNQGSNEEQNEEQYEGSDAELTEESE